MVSCNRFYFFIHGVQVHPNQFHPLTRRGFASFTVSTLHSTQDHVLHLVSRALSIQTKLLSSHLYAFAVAIPILQNALPLPLSVHLLFFFLSFSSSITSSGKPFLSLHFQTTLDVPLKTAITLCASCYHTDSYNYLWTYLLPPLDFQCLISVLSF